MKKLNRKLIRGTNWALAGLLSLLGFTGCGKDDNGGGEISVEYGSPSSYFKVLGRVTNEQGQPLGGMRGVSSGSIPKFFTRMGVFVLSGLMQLMRMPSASHSCATACTKLTMAALVDE